MGTRCDFYIGRGPDAEWLGSYPWDGYPAGVFMDDDNNGSELFDSDYLHKDDWRRWVSGFLAAHKDEATVPSQGWPWPWKDSNTTDYSYAWEDGVLYGTSFGYGWWRIDSDGSNWGEEDLPESSVKSCVFPDMTTRRAVTFGPRSGLIVVSAPEPTVDD